MRDGNKVDGVFSGPVSPGTSADATVLNPSGLRESGQKTVFAERTQERGAPSREPGAPGTTSGRGDFVAGKVPRR